MASYADYYNGLYKPKPPKQPEPLWQPKPMIAPGQMVMPQSGGLMANQPGQMRPTPGMVGMPGMQGADRLPRWLRTQVGMQNAAMGMGGLTMPGYGQGMGGGYGFQTYSPSSMAAGVVSQAPYNNMAASMMPASPQSSMFPASVNNFMPRLR